MTRAIVFGCVLIAATPLGCNSYNGFKLEPYTEPPGDVVVTSTMVEIPQGIAVAVRAITSGGEDPDTGELYVVLRSETPQVLQVWPTTSENSFVICGVSEGTGIIKVYVDGQSDDTISAVVGPPISAYPEPTTPEPTP
ncbi:MAG: hypothetical protein FWD57_02895 [Polyangiaceae bacterium]|nr:hypothetical protein [Polyangiaceae bacterium]